MHILHINSGTNVSKIDEFIKNGSDVFILVFMEGCGPCKATRPEWEKLESALKHQYANNDKLVIIDVNKDYLSQIKHIGDVDGYPTIKYIGSNGEIIESYENSSIKKKDRSVDSFINWIESKINKFISNSSPQHVYKRLSKTKSMRKTKSMHGGLNKGSNKGSNKGKRKTKKWSRKYKSSINCNKPKGFSQKQYCKYGRTNK
jgi:thiol-disulfide isomerase/thioredoxin